MDIEHITNREAVEQVAEEAVQLFGAVDGIINNAGIIQDFVSVNEMEYRTIERVMNINFYGTLYMVKSFLPHLLTRPQAHIVNVSSMGAFAPVPGQTFYGASKAAVRALTEGLMTELMDTHVEVSEVFPEARVARMDLDTTRTRNAYERIITDFSAGRTNILIGTQMISKGLDFDKVSVVGILNADTMLNYPDFRAYEHAFTMMSQVSGRAGRKGKRGLVILQTKNKDLSVIQQVVRNDYTSLYKDMIAERQAFRYPPYYHLVYVFLKHSHDEVVNTAGVEMGSRLRQWFGGRVLGPDKPAVAKVKSQNIRKLVLKLENGIDMKRVREYLLLAQSQILADKRYASLQIYYDVDPL